MKCIVVVSAVFALVAVSHALPFVEEKWDAEDALLSRVFQESTPIANLLQDDGNDGDGGEYTAESAQQADATAQENTAAGDKAANDEAESEQEEARIMSEANKLAQDQAAHAEKAANDNAAASASLNSYMADVATKTAAAAKSSADAAAALAASKAELASIEEELANAAEDEKAEIEARKAETQKTLDDNAQAVSDEEAAMEKLKTESADYVKKYEADKAQREADYQKSVEEHEAAKEAMEEKFAADDELHIKSFEKEMSANAENATAWNASIAKEKTENDAASAKLKADIDAKYDAIDALHADADAKEQAQKQAAQLARDQEDADKEAAAKAKANELDVKLKAALAKAQAATDVADEEHAKFEERQKASEAHTKAEEKLAAAARAHDGALANCADDECMTDDYESCKKVDDKNGPWRIDASWSTDSGVDGAGLFCTDDPKKGEPNLEGNATWGNYTAYVRDEQPPPTDACLEAMKAASEQAKALGVDIPEEPPATSEHPPIVDVACNGIPDEPTADDVDARKAAIAAVADALGQCPQFCFPGSQTKSEDGSYTEGGSQDTRGDCLDGAIFAPIADSIRNTATVVASGTGNRFDAGYKNQMESFCTTMESTIAGFDQGQSS